MKLNDTQRTELIGLYQAGASTPQLAKKYGVSIPTIRLVLEKAGIPFRSPGSVKGPRPERAIFSTAQQDQIVALMKSGLTMVEVARQMGVTPPTIHRYVRKLGVHTPRKDLAQYGPAMLQAMSQGTHVDAVARTYGTSRAMVYCIIDRMGVDLSPILVAKRAEVRPSLRERLKLRHAREKARAQVDPVFKAYLLRKYAKRRTAVAAIFAPVLNRFFQQGCLVCGETRIEALDADHRDPWEKTFTIGQRIARGVTPEQLAVELGKCDCICAYCHRIRHYDERKQNPKPAGTSLTTAEVAKARVRLTPLFDAFRANGCQICARKHHAGLSAHHVDPSTKLFILSRAIPLRMRTEAVQAELLKCVCLCESCHRLIHSGDLKLPGALQPTSTN